MIQYRRELYKLLPPEFVAAELGSAEGNFSLDLLEMGAGHLYLIDNWAYIPDVKGDGNYSQEWHDNNFYAAMARIVPHRDKVTVLKGMTDHMAHQVPDESLDMVYVDAAHHYEGVKADIHSYWGKLKPGGIMAFHDAENESYGVKAAVLEFAARNNLTVHDIPEDKPEDAGAWIRKA